MTTYRLIGMPKWLPPVTDGSGTVIKHQVRAEVEITGDSGNVFVEDFICDVLLEDRFPRLDANGRYILTQGGPKLPDDKLPEDRDRLVIDVTPVNIQQRAREVLHDAIAYHITQRGLAERRGRGDFRDHALRGREQAEVDHAALRDDVGKVIDPADHAGGVAAGRINPKISRLPLAAELRNGGPQ